MSTRHVWALMATLALVASLRAEEPAKPTGQETVAKVVKAVRDALGDDNYVAVTEACERAKTLRPECTADDFEPVMHAVARGVKHSDVSIAIVSIRTLPALETPGASRYLRPLLSPAKRVKPEKWNLYLAAIEAAGEIHDPATISDLERLLRHPVTDFAVAGAHALAGYAKADRETRRDVVARLAKWLGRFEKSTPRTTIARVHHGLVTDATVEALRSLTSEKKIEKADDARAWLIATEDGKEPGENGNPAATSP